MGTVSITLIEGVIIRNRSIRTYGESGINITSNYGGIIFTIVVVTNKVSATNELVTWSDTTTK
jgi:hypothetical protein